MAVIISKKEKSGGGYMLSLSLPFSSLNLSDKIWLCTDVFGCVSANANSYSQYQSHPLTPYLD